MRKRIIALLLALILTVSLLPTVALAAEGETPATDNSVVIGKIENGSWSQGAPTKPTVEGVKTVDKAATKIEDNKYQVTLTVVLEQTEEEQKPGTAATVLVLDTSGSMAYCAECGAKDDCVHNYIKFNGTPKSSTNYYYKTKGEKVERAYYCDGKHEFRPWLKHSAGWFTTSGDELLNHHPTTDSLAGQTIYVKSATPRASRLDAAKTAAQNFLRIYSGLKFDNNGNLITGQTARNLGRYVSVVTFATGVTLRKDWVDVSDPIKYAEVLSLFTSNNLKADGGTNLDAGLTYAEYLLKKDTVKNATKSVIALTDGEPTYYLSTNKRCIDGDCDCKNGSTGVGTKSYYVHGHGNACSSDTKPATDSAANAIKANGFADLYTICFGVANDKMKQKKDGNHIEYWPNNLTVGQYLQSIASSKAGKQFAYTADNAEQLNTAFVAITDTIVSGLNTGTVKDSLPKGITATGMSGEMTWKLDEDFTAAEPVTTTEDGRKVTTYKYTKTYTVTINPDDKDLVTTGDGYAPLNGETTLTVEVAGEEKNIPFPIPAGKVTMPSHTVTWKSQDGITTLETDNNVEYNTQPSFDQADPTKADDAQYTYTFVGWATEANKETGTLEADLPPVTDDVTYYAAFSKTPRTYTVTWMPQDGQGNAYETDTGVAYNARPSYDGTEPTKAADAEHTYTFVGWATTTNQTSGSTVDALPNVTADVTYYAAFSATKQTYTIRFETEAGGTLTGTTECTGLSYGADFPAAPTTTSNVGYYFAGWYDANDNKVTDWPNTVTENATYTAKWTRYTPFDLDLTGKIQKTLNSDVELSNQRFTINVKQTGAEVASATATATVSATTISDPGYTGSAPFQKDDFKLNFTAPGIYNYSIVEAEDGQLAGMTYDVGFDNGHTMIVNVDENTTTNELYVKSVTIDGKPVYAHGETEATPTWLTITNNYVEPKNAQVTNKEVVVTQPEGALKTAVYDFEIPSGATVLYPTGNGTTSNTLEVSYGTTAATLLYKITVYAGTESSYTFEDKDASFVYAENAKTVTKNGDYFTVTFEDGAEYAYVYVAVTHAISYDADGEYKARNFIGSQGAETTVTEKDPNKLTINFADFVKKELTATGSKTANDVKFRVIVNGMESPYMMYNVGEEEVSTYAAFDPKYSTVLNVNFASITGGNTETEWFIADNSIVIDQAGIYYFELNEEDGKRTGVTYDDSIYKVLVYVERKDDKLVVKSFDIMKDNVYVDGDTITFHNTIDTGKDDYYPIIIPTIINKDTGMLNKTDHFAYVIGYPDGTVHPNGQITRAEVATIFFRLLRDEVRDGAFTTSNSYSDVAYGKWYNNPISTMSALGIITGYPDGTFKPNKPITRAEFAAIAARFDETQSGKSATFSDVIGHWAAKEIGIAYYNDWIKGYPDGTFKPDQNITRAEAMTLINRVLERKPESPADLLTNMNKWTDNLDTSKWYYLDVQEATNSHGYTRKTFNYELWRQMLPDPDWSRYER